VERVVSYMAFQCCVQERQTDEEDGVYGPVCKSVKNYVCSVTKNFGKIFC
jgi:hypothetical protein